MTRKDYERIAAAVARGAAEAKAEGHDMRGLRSVVIELALTLADENPRFDRKRFMAACGVDA
ncbi:hypothetical protein [uncultured Xanthomonas sp.]|uniref:hypothetical protein n=1 Tax=uncultured Xanthomonas sp. TaxID=152831 RepID=UPI0025D8D7DC|nr:hypothetical protein [uncultured Xanthomonas sp.]